MNILRRQQIAFWLVVLLCFASFFRLLLNWSPGQLLLSMGLLVAALALFSAKLNRSLIEECKLAFLKVQSGDFATRLYIPDTEDTYDVSRSFNEMMEAIQERERVLESRIREQDSVLTSMTEGVIALGPHDRILRVNEAAARLLGFQFSHALGRTFQEVVRHADLLQFLEQVRHAPEKIEADVVLQLGGERILRTYGVPMHDASGASVGNLLVFSDVTRMHHLEVVRREFVANVSHELRTPITAIKGFVETLDEGAIENPEDAKRFIEIIGRQANRLNAIFEDLLTLSRVEEGNRQRSIIKTQAKLEEVVKEACAHCAHVAQQKNISIVNLILGSFPWLLNATLLEQAIVNLIQNAIAYSDAGTTVTVSIEENDRELCIVVSDQGVGIEPAHLTRIFERFYRVEKARTRATGGTGLGLSIVKHVAEAHGGKASVTSKVGVGSRFVIHLPRGVENNTL
jgi:two-component system phosphate regulon sensor histidine kinase PhoR